MFWARTVSGRVLGGGPRGGNARGGGVPEMVVASGPFSAGVLPCDRRSFCFFVLL